MRGKTTKYIVKSVDNETLKYAIPSNISLLKHIGTAVVENLGGQADTTENLKIVIIIWL